jgi:drug/metabolite transporter (DMT)-like permease
MLVGVAVGIVVGVCISVGVDEGTNSVAVILTAIGFCVGGKLVEAGEFSWQPEMKRKKVIAKTKGFIIFAG